MHAANRGHAFAAPRARPRCRLSLSAVDTALSPASKDKDEWS